MKPDIPGKLSPGYLFVIPWDMEFVGGVNEVVRNLYGEFEELQETRPSILIPKWGCSRLVRLTIEGRDTFNLRMQELPGGKNFCKAFASFLIRWPATLWQLYNLLKTEQIEVVNPHYPGPFLLYFAILKKIFRQPFRFIISLHGSDVTAMEKAPASETHWILRSADVITVPSNSLASRVARLAPETTDRIKCVYNGISNKKFAVDTQIADPLPTELSDADYVIHVGSFEPVKGQDVLLHAFKKVLLKHPHLKLLMVGRSGTYLAEIDRICKDQGISGAVFIKTDVAADQIPHLMDRSLFLVLPSRSEGGIPLVLLEAGALKKAVIASDVGGIPELITQGQNGLLVPPDNPQALAQAMLTLLDNPQLMLEMGNNLYYAVSGSYSWKKTACHYLELAMA